MATQTEGQVQSEIKNRIAIFQELRKFGHVNSSGALSNYIAREITALADVQGDYSKESNAELAGFRGLLAGAINNTLLQRVIDPLLRNYARVDTTIVELDGPSILSRLYLRFIANSLSVKSRGISFGSVSAGSNIGNGTINRLTVDAYGYNIEATHLEAKKALCIRDEFTGADEHEEVFEFRGSTLLIDQLQVSGSGISLEVTALSARRSLAANASFSSFSGDSITSLTEVSGWTPGAETISNYELDQTNYYRTSGGSSDPDPASLKFLSNGTMTQLFSFNSISLNPDAPIYVQIAYNRSVGSCNGRLTLQVGNDSASVDLSGASSGWQILRLPLTKMRYPRNFSNLNTATIVITLSGRTTGTLLVDDLIMAPFTRVDGLYYALVGGATPFVGENRDTFTWTDALSGTDSIIQQWLWRIYGAYLPYKADGSETWSDPTV